MFKVNRPCPMNDSSMLITDRLNKVKLSAI